jgi:hypothetical protein
MAAAFRVTALRREHSLDAGKAFGGYRARRPRSDGIEPVITKLARYRY